MPPSTTTTNTIGPIASAIPGSTTDSGAAITPASAASTVPMANTAVNTRSTSWPSVSTIDGCVSAARTISPVFDVRSFDVRRTSQSAASVTSASIIMKAR